MAKPITTLLALFSLLLFSYSFSQKLGFHDVLLQAPDKITTFCVPDNATNRLSLEKQGVKIKYSTKEWLFISATPAWIHDNWKSGAISNFYFEFAPPALLSDTARMHHFVNEIHAGSGGLNTSYTGKGVIIGVVDTGIDVEHPDFKTPNGKTRVLRYWDQSMPDNASSPALYGYGFIWDSSAINAGLCTSMDGSGHGCTVAGQAAGNGLANGMNKGMAPEADLIIVETDFSRPNWTLTVADACDYIFKVADSLDMPAVVNLSLGSYLGSHDGNDPASVVIENLLDEKPGRIVVCAAGNSGNQGRHHQQGNPTSDTNFVWFVNNGSNNAAFGPNTVFFDLWSDLDDTTFQFAFGINNQGPSWSDRGRTGFHGAASSIGTPIYDTVWNGSNRLATIEVYTEINNGNFHMQFLARVDSAGLRYRFETTGSGKYDLWSGEWLGLNNQYWYGAPLAEFPDSIYYVGPDTLQSIVSSWNCSEKVISVGNMRNRKNHIDKNGNTYVSADNTPVGKLSPNSSKGPNRHNVVKPDITAAGDVSLSAGPLWILTNPAWNASVDSGGWHVRNGGTSMASPVVAGIAALYLERCGRATYQDFKNDITSTAYSDLYTGTTPNYAYGFGKIHGLNSLLEKTPPTPPTISSNWNGVLTSSTEAGYQWYLNEEPLLNETNQDLNIVPPYGDYQVLVINNEGCTAISAPFTVTVSLAEEDERAFSTYPNPATQTIRVNTEYEVISVVLIDLSGKTYPIKELGSGEYSLENIPKGAYIISIDTNQGEYSSKVIRL